VLGRHGRDRVQEVARPAQIEPFRNTMAAEWCGSSLAQDEAKWAATLATEEATLGSWRFG
jgi:hypothetical protein